MKSLPENKKVEKNQCLPYEAPAVLYEGAISTRAGSPLIVPDGNDVDPADLFEG